MKLPNWMMKALARLMPPNYSASGNYWFPMSTAGMHVDHSTALTYSAVWGCVRIISETLAMLPWHVFEQMGESKEERSNSTLQWLLNNQPNPEITAFTFKETLVGHALTWGNGYAEIERDGMGRAIALWLITPDRVTPWRDDQGVLWYRVLNYNTAPVDIPVANMFHLHGLGFDGMSGYSVITMAAKGVGLGMALEEFGSAFFANGAHLGAVIQAPPTAKLGQVAVDKMLESFNDKHKTPAKSGKIEFLDQGMEYKTIGIPPENAQFLESRKFQVTEIARWYRVPPHKLADLERATFSNIEHQSIEFVTDCIMPWVVRLEQEANIKLVGKRQWGKIYTKLNVNALLRGDMKSRFEAYAIGRQWGWLCVDDIRELEDMNPLPDGQGDIYLEPMNMKPAGTEPPGPTNNDTPPSDQLTEDETQAVAKVLRLMKNSLRS